MALINIIITMDARPPEKLVMNEEFMNVYLGPESISDLFAGTLVHGQWTSVRY